MKMIKKNKVRIGFLVLLIVTVYLVSNIFRIKSPHGINQLEGLYWQPNQAIDVVMMGTSHIHCGVNTALLWEKYGIAAYDYSGAEQPLWMTYYYLKELYKYQDPKVVVLDMYAPARFKEDYQYDWISENIYGMRFSFDKLAMLTVSVEPPKIFQYFPSFSVYHSRYDDLEKNDFEHFFWNWDEKEAFKGYTPYWQQSPQQIPDITEGEKSGLSDKSEEYLGKIIDFMKKKDGELILITVPYVVTNEDQKTYNKIAEIAEKEGVKFMDYNSCYDEIGLDFEKDFNDESHLNYWGSCKFTEYLGNYLASFGSISDKRGQEGYQSWNDHVEMINQEFYDHQDAQ